ncbi:hypothetical protein NF27_AT00010, partial [Candidatus Jidaibacter acanthamoeba]
MRAVEALGKVGVGHGEIVIPVLRNALKNEYGDVRSSAAEALGNIGVGHADVVVPALINASKDINFWIRKSSATKAIGKVGVGREERVGCIIVSKVTDNTEITKINGEESLNIVTLYCFKHGSEPFWIDLLPWIEHSLWIERSLKHFLKTKSYVIFNGNTLIVKDLGRTHEITFTEAQKKTLLEVFKESATERGLSTEVYDYYLGKGTLGFRREVGVIEKTELHKAAESGDLEGVKSILTQGRTDINDQNNEEKDTPLIIAAKHGHIGVVKYLVNQGADVSCLNRQGDDALNISLFINHNIQQVSILTEKYFITEQRLRKLLEVGMVSYSGRADDVTVADIVYEITGNGRLKNWKNDIEL